MQTLNPITYPHFTNISLEEKKKIRNFIKNFPPYSDFNFTSLISWNLDNSFKFCFLNDNLILKLKEYVTQKNIISILGESEIDQTIDLLLKENNQLNLIPEIVVKKIRYPAKYKIEEDRGNHDYIYSIDKFINFKGNKLRGKRNFLNRFKKEYGSTVEYITIKKINNDLILKFNMLYTKWVRQSPQNPYLLNQEKLAFGNIIKSLSKLDLIVLIIINKLNKDIIAFSISEVIKDFGIIHFEKANLEYTGIYSFLNSVNGQILKDNGCKYINFEQDLDIPSLRKAKNSYQPIDFLKKYKISYS